jgi:glycosyltransferase involved in cell wall biosynthesis
MDSLPLPDQRRLALPAELPAHRLSLVVPMYDERENVAPLLAAVASSLAAYPRPWELVLVDDGSRDGTGAALRREADGMGAHVRVVQLLRNHGQSTALQAGIDASRGDVVVTLDGDLQNDPRDIPRLVQRLLVEDLDLVAGWRRERRDGFLLRRIPSLIANRLIRRTTGLAFHDLGCTLKAFRASVLHEVRLHGEMHRFIPAWLATVTAPERMAEEPVAHHPRARGRSKYGLSRTFRVILDLLSVAFFLRYRGRPAHFFGGAGLVVLALGVAMLGGAGAALLLGRAAAPSLLWSGTACVVGGVQLLSTGVLAELVLRAGDEGDRPRVASAGRPLPHDAGWHRALR